MKEYLRNCPKCNEVLTYKSKKTFDFANKKISIGQKEINIINMN